MSEVILNKGWIGNLYCLVNRTKLVMVCLTGKTLHILQRSFVYFYTFFIHKYII